MRNIDINQDISYFDETEIKEELATELRLPLPENALAWLSGVIARTRGERALWIAVITQAMLDAHSRSSTPESHYYKHQAMHWLTENRRDFFFVCELAGLEGSYVRRKFKQSLLHKKSFRLPPGEGRRYRQLKQYRKLCRQILSQDLFTTA